jgi:raffinose/stachyose/melibiose transport system permease protein
MKKSGKIESLLTNNHIASHLFLLPGLLFFLFSIGIPFIMGVNIAFTDWNGISPSYNYVGLKNFFSCFKDALLIKPILNSLEFAVLGTIFSNVVSLGLALLANQKSKGMQKAARLLFFVPVCFSSILTAFIWSFIYKDVFSELFGIQSMLGKNSTVIPAIVAMGIWNTSGINMMIYLSGLQSIPQELYEAALIDGANVGQRFKSITIPFLNSAFSVCCTLSLTSWLREFATTLSATGGGPGGASRTISIYIFENMFEQNHAGYGQAVALLFSIFLMIVGNAVSSFFRKREVEL